MITLDSKLGYALAKAKAELDKVRAMKSVRRSEYNAALADYNQAADAVANALIIQGMHKMDGL